MPAVHAPRLMHVPPATRRRISSCRRSWRGAPPASLDSSTGWSRQPELRAPVHMVSLLPFFEISSVLENNNRAHRMSGGAPSLFGLNCLEQAAQARHDGAHAPNCSHAKSHLCDGSSCQLLDNRARFLYPILCPLPQCDWLQWRPCHPPYSSHLHIEALSGAVNAQEIDANPKSYYSRLRVSFRVCWKVVLPDDRQEPDGNVERVCFLTVIVGAVDH